MDTKNFNYFDKLVARLRLLRALPYIEEGDELLDFGCGSQAFLLRSVLHKIKRGVGIDYDVDILNEEKLKLLSLKFENKLPFKKKSFDKVIMLAVLEHVDLDKVELLFKEFRRVLKDGGLIVLTTPTPFGKNILEFLAFKLKIISDAEIRDHKKYYSKVDMLKLANRSGFELNNYKLFQFGINSVAVFKKN